MEERRKFGRYSKKLKAQYRLTEGEDWKECTVTDISREGFGIKLQTNEKINAGSPIYLKVLYHEGSRLVYVKGTLIWSEEKEDHFIGGIEWHLIEKVRE